MLASETKTRLLGGDTTKSRKHLIINIAVLGTAFFSQIKLRSGARDGDVLCVTDKLGDSGAGLRILLDNLEHNNIHQYLINRHHRPRAHIAEGTWLAQHAEVHSMIDVSDGIDADIHRIMERSHCGATVNLEKLPLSDALKQATTDNKWDAYELAVAGGEDYCLLCSIDNKKYPLIAQEYKREFMKDLYPIGSITKKNDELLYYLNNKRVKLAAHGFDHFTGERK